MEKISLYKLVIKSTLLEPPTPGKQYKQVGVQLWGKGIYERDSIDGINTGYKYFNRLLSGDLILNKIWARNGAVSVVFNEFDGSYVSTEFPVFHLKQELIDPKWMYFITQQKWFWDLCNKQAFGTSGKNRIKPEDFLKIEIPLPPLLKQRSIISKIESIKQRLEQIREIRIKQVGDINKLLFSKYFELTEHVEWIPMSEVAPIIRRETEINEHENYPELGIRSFGKGTFHKPNLSGIDVGTKKLYQIKTGDLMFSNVFAWEGAIAVAKKEDNNRYGSHRFISCVPLKNVAISEYLCFHFLTEKGIEAINMASPGGAGRNKTLGLEKLMKILVPIPPIELQKEFVILINKMEALRAKYEQTEKELIELFPSFLDRVINK